MKDHAKSRVFAFVMTISILLSAFPFSFTAAADENAHQLTNDQIAVSDSQAEVMSTNAIGITLNYSQIELELGESQRLTATTNPAGQSVSWQSSDISIATVSDSGLVTAQGVGTTKILAMFMTSDRNMYVAECTVTVRLKEGEYFLQNKQTGYYADIKGPTMAAGTTIHQWNFNGNNSQRWNFTHLGNGYYSIKSANSTTPYYLGVINDSSGLDVDVVLRSGSLTNGMKWKIERTANDAYKLVPKTGEANGYTLATTTSSATNGAKLIQGAYVDNTSYRDEWTLLSNIDASLIALPETYDRSSYFSTIVDDLQSIGYDYCFNNHNHVSDGMNKAELLERMSHSRITLIRTHGSKAAISVSDGALTRSDLLALPTNTLSDSELIIYGACLTAEGGEYGTNLVSATVTAGARTVIGFKNPVVSGACDSWCIWFFQYYSDYYHNDNKTISDVCKDTDAKMQDDDYYEYIDSDKNLMTLRNYVIAGQKTFPNR